MTPSQKAEALRLDDARPLVTVSNIDDPTILWCIDASHLLRTLAAEAPNTPDFLPWDDQLRFIRRMLDALPDTTDRRDAQQMVTDMRTSLRPKPTPDVQPVAWVDSPHGAIRANPNYRWEKGPTTLACSVPLYLHPAPAQTPLTDHDLKPIVQRAMQYYGYDPSKFGFTASAGFVELARDIEAAHGINP